MKNNKLYFPRCVRIAKLLLAEKGVVIPRSVFDDIKSYITSKDGIYLVSQRPNHGSFEVNGYMKEIRKAVNSLQKKYKGKYEIIIDNKSAQERKRCLVVIRPILPNLPEKAKAKFENGVVHFVDGPFRGEEVIWSSRVDFSEIPSENDIKDDIFIVEPDKYRATFYGWKRKY